MIEYESAAVNVFQYIKNLNTNFISAAITPEVCKVAFQYVIQTAHALAIAHLNDLTHGKFNLSQVLVTDPQHEEMPNFKVTSFRPWLVGTLKPLHKLMDSERLQIAKCRDLFDFGVSIFEFMIGKKTETEKAIMVQVD